MTSQPPGGRWRMVPWRRLDPAEQDRLQQELALRYEAGESIRDLAVAYGRPYASIHARLVDAGVQMRPRGGPRGLPTRRLGGERDG